MRPEDYPILSELYDFIEIEYENFDETKPQLYTRETLQQVLLGLHSMCRGADSKFFNGHTNLTSTQLPGVRSKRTAVCGAECAQHDSA